MSTPPRSRLALVALNSSANGIRAISGSLVTMVLPLVLVALLAKNDFAVWALCFSIASFVLYLDLGIPTTLQALVSSFDGAGDGRSAVAVVKSGLRVVALVSLACVAVGSVVAANFTAIFPDVETSLVAIAGPTLIIVLCGQLSNLLANAGSAYFAGLQRSPEPTRVMVPARIGSLILATGAALVGTSVVVIAVAYALPLIVGCALIFAKFFSEARALGKATGKTTPGTSARSILAYSGPLIVWNLSLLFVTGAGLAIVGRVDYDAVAAYAVANIFAVGITSLDSALLASLIPEFSRAHVAKDRARLAGGVRRASRVNSIFVTAMAVAIIALAPIISLLLIESGERSLGILLIIGAVVTASLRAYPAPLSLAFVATGTHKRIYWPPVVEAIVTFSLCVYLGVSFGALGVAVGSVSGAVLGMAMAFVISRRISGVVDANLRQMSADALLLPLLPTVPFALTVLVVSLLGQWAGYIGVTVVIVAGLASVALSWLVLPVTEKATVRRLLNRLVRRGAV